MNKRECRKLAIKYYKRNLAARTAIHSLPIEEQVKRQHTLFLLTNRLHQVFDTIESIHGRKWTSELYKQSADIALGIC